MKGVPRLTQLAAEAERIIFEMPPASQEQALVGLKQIFLGAQALTVLPDELMTVCWQAAMAFFMGSVVPGRKKKTMVMWIFDGAPRTLGTIRPQIEGVDIDGDGGPTDGIPER